MNFPTWPKIDFAIREWEGVTWQGVTLWATSTLSGKRYASYISGPLGHVFSEEEKSGLAKNITAFVEADRNV